MNLSLWHTGKTRTDSHIANQYFIENTTLNRIESALIKRLALNQRRPNDCETPCTHIRPGRGHLYGAFVNITKHSEASMKFIEASLCMARVRAQGACACTCWSYVNHMVNHGGIDQSSRSSSQHGQSDNDPCYPHHVISVLLRALRLSGNDTDNTNAWGADTLYNYMIIYFQTVRKSIAQLAKLR